MKLIGWIIFLIEGAIRNLLRAPRRTLISLCAIAAAAASLIVFQAFVEGVRSSFRASVITSRFGHYQIFDRESYDKKEYDSFDRLIDIDDSFRTKLEAEVGPLTFLSRQIVFFGLVSNGDKNAGARGVGIDAKEEAEFLTLTQVHRGKHLSESGPQGIFLGYEFAEKINTSVGDTITVVVNTAEGSINAFDFEVTGTFKSGVTEMDTSMYFIHHQTARELMGVEGAQKLLIGFKSNDEKQYEAKLAGFLSKNYPQLKAIHWETLASYFKNTMGWLDSIFFVFRIIIILIATLSIINVFTITLLERTGEFGTLRAIGTRPSEILAMVMTEGMMQATVGSALGAGLGMAVITFGLAGGVTMPPPLMMSVPFHVAFAIPWEGLTISTLLVALVAGGAGIIPAIRVSRINIVQALGRNV